MFDYFNYFAAKGNHPNKQAILDLENQLIFDYFNEEITKKMINTAISEAKEKYQRNMGIRINYLNKIYQYLMEDVKEDWLLRKEKVCLETKHSSYYIFLENIESHQYDYMVEDESYGVCGGSFPLIINGSIQGAITCTGLRPQEDHQVVIDILKKILKKEED